jgi:hypothetical protein
MKYLIVLLLSFMSQVCFAQKEFFLTFSGGWKVSYDKLQYDKPLPEGLQWSRWSGFSSAAGIEYKISPHWGIHAQIKTASVEMGLRIRVTTLYDTINSKYYSVKGGGGSSLTSHAPAHIQLGTTYYSEPIKGKKFSWLLGGGVAYLFNNETEIRGSSSGIGFLQPENKPGYVPYYGKFYGVNMYEEYSRDGILMNIHAGIDLHFAEKHHLLLTLQHNEGLKYIWKYRSDYFYTVEQLPTSNNYEYYHVNIKTKGSYTALQLGYKYALFGQKKS